MDKIRGFIDSFVTEDYFIIFLVLLVMILVVLVMALIKTRNQYYEEFNLDNYLNKNNDDILDSLSNQNSNNDLLSSLKDDKEEELPPINKDFSIRIPTIETYDNIINKYENSEEENAVISTEELEKKTQERFDELGVTDNQAMIQKYEDEQEKKAIISYEQLLKNASNITISYKEEETPEGSPKVNKIEVQEKEVSAPQNYIEEEQFLKILKEFRLSLPR